MLNLSMSKIQSYKMSNSAENRMLIFNIYALQLALPRESRYSRD